MAVEVAVQNGYGHNEETQQQQPLLEDVEENMDLTIITNRSELSVDSTHNNTEEVYKLGFSLNDLYKLSLEFYKKVKEELTLTYFDKVQLVALWKQATSGRYSQSKSPEVGYFDVIGNDRRKAWEALGDTEPDVAKQQFCELLEENCPSYVNFVGERRAEIDVELERKRLEEEERLRLEAEERERKRKEEEERIRLEEERIRLEEEEKVRLALEAEQRKLQEEQRRLEEEAKRASATCDNNTLVTATCDTGGSDVVCGHVEEINSHSTPNPKLVASQAISKPTSEKTIAPASLWTRPKLQEFINHVKRDASSVLVVGRGETVTVSVPTHALGSCLFWEFATEYYDVGFGVYFQWSKAKSPLISVNVNESDSNATKPVSNIEQQIVINENEDNVEVIHKPNTDEVLPVLRRNSHEQVIVGSHMYPGDGTYLLKFDNSYSLLRSKTLYYRVYYTK